MAEGRASLVTLSAIINDLGSIEARALSPIYPGAGPRRLYDIEKGALRSARIAQFSGPRRRPKTFLFLRERFPDAGGFDPGLDINEHREMALRLCENVMSVAPVAGRSSHITHRAPSENRLSTLPQLAAAAALIPPRLSANEVVAAHLRLTAAKEAGEP